MILTLQRRKLALHVPEMGFDDQSIDSSTEQTVTAASPTEATPEGHKFAHAWPHPQQDWCRRRKSSGRISERRLSLVLKRTQTGRQWWKFTLRPWDDDEDQDWWFASTAIPLLAATIGPLANVLSIAALVTSWRMCLVPGINSKHADVCLWNGSNDLGQPLEGTPFADPKWCYDLNIASLIVGFVGNFFLLCNFTQRIRYIIALPVTIILWYIATGILIGITVSMEVYKPPIRPQQTYTQGFWYAVIAAGMYMLCSMLLMINMLGYLLGHYPQHFELTESQRTLILQTMLFFIWLAGGGAVFSVVEHRYGNGTMSWSYVNALYFCDVTILTVGFGDLYPTSDVGRGLVFPFSVGGIIMLGLVVASISSFAKDIGSENIIRKHVERTRVRTIGRTVTTSLELEHRRVFDNDERPTISGPFDPVDRARTTTIRIADDPEKTHDASGAHSKPPLRGLKKVASIASNRPRQRKNRLILLREEKDRFDVMRNIQRSTAKFKRWYALCLSTIAFGLLWAVGAVVFWQCEKDVQGMTYFKALYFCYVSLLTIGYGDLAPQSNPGRPFFVLWSLIAVPTMTILVSDLGDTVINKFKHGTFKLADFTVLPKEGVWHDILIKHPWIMTWLQQRKKRRASRRRLEEGFQVGPEPELPMPTPTIEELARDQPSKQELARKLAHKIRQTADDVKDGHRKRYEYEEWVEITQLIRFTANHDDDNDIAEEEGLIEWDWIGEDSPMMAKGTEAEFVLDRLCESMQRYIRISALHSEDIGSGSRKPPLRQGQLYNNDSGKRLRGVRSSSCGSSGDNIVPLDTNTETTMEVDK